MGIISISVLITALGVYLPVLNMINLAPIQQIFKDEDMRKYMGFTLIELVIIIAIIGILAAIAIPRFINLPSNAQTASTVAIAGALSAANASNYASRKLSNTLGIPVANCTDVANAMQGGLPTGYTITGAGVSVDANVTCTLTGPNSTTATFTATGIN